MCGWLNGVIIQEATAKTLQPGEALSMGRSPLQAQSLLWAGVSYNILVWEPQWHPFQVPSQGVLPSGSLLVRQSLYVSLVHVCFYSPGRIDQLLFHIGKVGIFSYHPTSSVQFSSVAQSCPTLCDLMNCSTPGLPVHHQLPEFTQIHVHRVGDAIQPSHPLSSPSPPAPSPSQRQGLFQWVNSSHQVAKVLEFQLQHLSFQWTPRTDLLQDGLVGSPCNPRDSLESSPTP